LAELGNDEFSSRRERRRAEKKTLSKSARKLASSTRARSEALVVAAQEVVAAKVTTPQVSRSGRTWARFGVMSLAAALVTTFSLPAYAVNHHSEQISVEEFQELMEQAQQIQLDGEAAAASATRDGYSTAAAVRAPSAGTAPRAVNGSFRGVDVSGIASNSSVLNSALGIVGMRGDCTAFVEQTLRNMGHSVGDLGPMQFGAYGTVFADPSQVQPGDIMMRGGHVAIYAGNGLAAHGGLGGMSYLTPIDASPGNYALFVRVG
jgi:cell wall-associated NlpC family hydrolase